MTKLEQKLQGFFNSLQGVHFRRIHAELLLAGLTEKDNNKTVLYHFGQSADGDTSLAAIRKDPASVLSFPSAYWSARRSELNSIIAAYNFTFNELKPPNPSVPSEKESADQILVSAATVERVLELIRVHIGPRAAPTSSSTGSARKAGHSG